VSIAPRILLLSAVVIWGWTFVATKILVAELNPVEMLAMRLFIGVPVLGVLLLVRRVPLSFTRADVLPLVSGGMILVCHFVIQIAGLETTTATNTAWLISVSPLAIVLLSFVVLREPVGRSTVAGLAVASAGIVLLVSGGRLTELGWLRSTGDWLILVSAFTWAIYTVATRNLSRRRPALAVTFVIMLVAAAVAAVLVWLWGDLGRVRSLTPRGVAAILYLAIPGLALGQWFWQEGVARLGASRAALYLYLEPIATLALAIPLLHEPFGLAAALGGALVLAGVYLGR
jgi:drug/metabolite transporter (DMT)-like permease